MTTDTSNLAEELILKRNPKPFPFLRGANFGFLSKRGYYDSLEAERQLDAMREAGVEWVSLMVAIMQETFASTRVFADYLLTPSDDELERIIGKIHARGMRVMLKPAIECWDSAWRGRIHFPYGDQQIQGITVDYWGQWFASKTQAMVYYARMSQRLGVEAFTAGQELDATENEHAHWLRLLGAVRDVYTGWVTYNTTTSGALHALKCDRAKWFGTCDALGTSYYPVGMEQEEPTREDLMSFMRRDAAPLREVSEKLGVKIYWAECGCRSASGAARVPYDYASPWPYNGETQARFFDAMLAAFWDEPWWAGFQYWKWDEHQKRPHYAQAGGDAGFTIQGKPAEAMMSKWCRENRAAFPSIHIPKQ